MKLMNKYRHCIPWIFFVQKAMKLQKFSHRHQFFSLYMYTCRREKLISIGFPVRSSAGRETLLLQPYTRHMASVLSRLMCNGCRLIQKLIWCFSITWIDLKRSIWRIDITHFRMWYYQLIFYSILYDEDVTACSTIYVHGIKIKVHGANKKCSKNDE